MRSKIRDKTWLWLDGLIGFFLHRFRAYRGVSFGFQFGKSDDILFLIRKKKNLLLFFWLTLKTEVEVDLRLTDKFTGQDDAAPQQGKLEEDELELPADPSTTAVLEEPGKWVGHHGELFGSQTEAPQFALESESLEIFVAV